MGARTAGTLPLLDPLFNLREAAKQLILLEDHLAHPAKHCPDCIRKHLLCAEAFLEEAVTLDKTGDYQELLQPLPGAVRQVWTFHQDGAATQRLGQLVRQLRKSLVAHSAAVRVASAYKSKKKVKTPDGERVVYEYSERHKKKQDKEKAQRVEKLRQALPKLRTKYRAALKDSDPEARLTALAVALIDCTYERVGNETSAKEGHFGVTGWQKKHVSFSGSSATFKYTGKSGVAQEKKVTDAKVVAALKEAVKGKKPGDKILCDGDDCVVGASQVNSYLKQFDVTAKDLRGVHANEEMRTHLKAVRSKGGKLPEDKKEREKKLKDEFKEALELASTAVGHSASMLRSSYLVPGLEDAYLKDGTVMKKLTKKAAYDITAHCPHCQGILGGGKFYDGCSDCGYEVNLAGFSKNWPDTPCEGLPCERMSRDAEWAPIPSGDPRLAVMAQRQEKVLSWLTSRTAAGNQEIIEAPHNYHPVKVEPPKAKRKQFPFEGFIDFQGLKIDVENKKGSVRSGTSPDGSEWSIKMHAHYGEIRGTEGTDGDKLDVYVGENHDSSVVVVIHQQDPDTGKFDEDKVMLGFDSPEEAIGLYKKQYDKPGFFKDGEYLTMPVGQFWRWVKEDRNRGKKMRASSWKVAERWARVNPPKGRWVEVTTSSLDPEEKDQVWDLYSTAYGSIGLHISSLSAFMGKYKLLRLLDVDDDPEIDAFIAFKKTPFGNKLALMGTDGSRRAKLAALRYQGALMKKRGWYAEASGKIASVFSAYGIPRVEDQAVVERVLSGKDITWQGGGYYTRSLGGLGQVRKSLYGSPKVRGASVKTAIISLNNATDGDEEELWGIPGLLSSLTLYELALMQELLIHRRPIIEKGDTYQVRGHGLLVDAVDELVAAGYLEKRDDKVFLSDLFRAKAWLYTGQKLATKTRSEKEDEAAEDLVKPSPKKKPPRTDLQRRRVREDDDRDPDKDQDRKDRSQNYKDSAERVAQRFLAQAKVVKVRKKDTGKVVYVTEKALRENPRDYEAVEEEEPAPADDSPAPEQGEGETPSEETPAETSEPERTPEQQLQDKQKELMSRYRQRGLLEEDIQEILEEVSSLDDVEVAEELLEEEADKAEKKQREEAERAREEKARKQKEDLIEGSLSSLDSSAGRAAGDALEGFDEDQFQEYKEQLSQARAAIKDAGPEGFNRAEAESSRKLLKDTLGEEGDELRKDPAQLARALAVVEYFNKVVDNPLLDVRDPFPDSGEPLSGDDLTQAQEAAVERALDGVEKYTDLSKEDRERHLDTIEREIKTLQPGDPRRVRLEGVQRAIGVASALEDGDDARGIGATMSTLTKAAQKSGNLKKLLAVGTLGGSEALEGGDQALIRSVYEDLTPDDFVSVIPDDHPGKEIAQTLADPDLSKNMSPQDHELMKQVLVDMMLAETAFLDPAVNKRLDASSTVRRKYKEALKERTKAVPKREMPPTSQPKALVSWFQEMMQNLVKNTSSGQKSENKKEHRPGDVWPDKGKFKAKNSEGVVRRFDTREEAYSHAKLASATSWDFSPWGSLFAD